MSTELEKKSSSTINKRKWKEDKNQILSTKSKRKDKKIYKQTNKPFSPYYILLL